MGKAQEKREAAEKAAAKKAEEAERVTRETADAELAAMAEGVLARRRALQVLQQGPRAGSREKRGYLSGRGAELGTRPLPGQVPRRKV